MTFDPERVTQEFGEMVERIEEQIEQWREHGSPADKACADEIEEILDDYR